jgi:hypothetical protein
MMVWFGLCYHQRRLKQASSQLFKFSSVSRFSCFAKLVSFVISAVSRNCKTRPSFSRNTKIVCSQFRETKFHQKPYAQASSLLKAIRWMEDKEEKEPLGYVQHFHLVLGFLKIMMYIFVGENLTKVPTGQDHSAMCSDRHGVLRDPLTILFSLSLKSPRRSRRWHQKVSSFQAGQCFEVYNVG